MLTVSAALWFLPFCLPIAFWVAWSDMKRMKIPNKAVIAMFAVSVVVGFFVFDLQVWGWSLAIFAVVLLIGFVTSAIGLIGAGDAKFAAAMAPVFVTANLTFLWVLTLACLLGAFVTHRIARAIPAVRRATPDWASWTHAKFPMGLALSGTLIFYLFAPILLH